MGWRTGLIYVVVLGFLLTGCQSNPGGEVESSGPVASQPGSTQPESTRPGSTQPESAQPRSTKASVTEELWTKVNGYWSCREKAMGYFMELRYDETTNEATRLAGWFHPGGYYQTASDKLAYAYKVSQVSKNTYDVSFRIPPEAGSDPTPELFFSGVFDISQLADGILVVTFEKEVLTFEYSASYEEARAKS